MIGMMGYDSFRPSGWTFRPAEAPGFRRNDVLDAVNPECGLVAYLVNIEQNWLGAEPKSSDEPRRVSISGSLKEGKNR